MRAMTSTRDLHAHLARLYETGRYRETVSEAVGLEAPTGADAVDLDLALTFLVVGCAHRELNELSAAEAHLLAALRTLGTGEGQSRPVYRRGLRELGYLYELKGRYDQAETLYLRALKLHAQSEDPEDHARCLHALFDLYRQLDRRREALEALQQAQEIRARSLGTNHPEYARGLLAEAMIGMRTGKSQAAEAMARQALATSRTAYGERHSHFASALHDAGRVLLGFAHLDEAERCLTQARDIRRESFGEAHPDFATTLGSLAMVKLARCQPKEAETLTRRAVQITRAALGESRLEFAWALEDLGNALQEGWKLTEAEECHRQAYDVLRMILGEQSPVVAEQLAELAETLYLAGRLREAEDTLRQAVALLGQAGPEAAFERLEARSQLTRLYLRQGRYEEADRLAGQARQEAGDIAQDDPFIVVPACLLRAQTLHAIGEHQLARKELTKVHALVKPFVPHHPLAIEAAQARMDNFLQIGDLDSAVIVGGELARALAKALGEMHPSHALTLRSMAELRHREGKFEEAERLFERALSLLRRHYGPEHPEIADTLRGLAWLHLSRNNAPAAESRLRQVCDIRRAALGEQHPAYAEGLRDLAVFHQQTGNLVAADMYYGQVLDVLRVNPGEDHADYAAALHGRAAVLHAADEPAQAEKLLEQALRILEVDTDQEHPLAREVSRSLAQLHISRSDFQRAEALLKQALTKYEKALPKDHEELVPTLGELVNLYGTTGDLVAASAVMDRIRGINVRVHGGISLRHASDLVTAGNLSRLLGDVQQAEAQLRRALNIASDLLPEAHPGLLDFLCPLALLCRDRQAYGEAERLMERALSGAEAAFGPQHPSVTACQSELAELAALKGRHAEASRRFEQVADLICNSRGEDHPDHAEARRVLGLHCQSQGDYSRAETALRKALQVTRRTAGERHPAVAARMQNLAELSRARGDLAEATDYYREALDVLRYLDTPCDALHANLLHGQAVVLLQQGRPKEAEPLLRAALDIDSSSGDEATPGHAGSVLTLGELHAAAGRDQEASALFGKALEAHFQLAASFGCMLQSSTLSSFWNHYWELSERLLTLAVRTPLPALTIRFLFDVVLRVKGLSSRGMVVAELDELSERHPELHQRLQTRFFLGRQTAARVMRGAGAEGLETHRRLLTSWQEKRESLEQELEPQVPALARQRRWLALDAEQVSAALAPEAVLVEYVCYRPRDFTGLCAQKEKPGPAHYAAFAIVAGRPKDVRLIELGEAAPIDRLAQNTHALWGRRQTGESLANRLLTPLASHIQGACPVVVAANGPLERVRFVDLPGGAGVQRQVTSGRELLDLPAAVGANKADGWLHRLWRWLPGRQ